MSLSDTKIFCLCLCWEHISFVKSQTWKHKRRASSPLEFLKLEKPQSISLMSTVPSRLLSNKSNIRGARGISDGIFIAFSTSSNSERVALSPFTHLLIANSIFFFSPKLSKTTTACKYLVAYQMEESNWSMFGLKFKNKLSFLQSSSSFSNKVWRQNAVYKWTLLKRALIPY